MTPAEITMSESPVAFTTTEDEVTETHSEAVANINDIDLTLDKIQADAVGGEGYDETTENVVVHETTTIATTEDDSRL